MNSLDHSRTAPVELLAPAGGPVALVAAVNNGADAVYLGLGELNARRGADNFDATSLAEATRFAHLRHARVYLAANVVVLPHEMDSALALVDEAWALGVDAVIVQDLGLMRLIRQELPDVRIHASTQANAMNPAAVLALAEAGSERVTLARELDIDAIAACAATGIEVETFVHGAICYSYSGQCLMSSMIGGRSANRGMCAQPCRLPYELIDPSGAAADAPGRYLLSPRDMAGLAHLPALVAAGVRSLKIEGRMKSPEYVAVVTSVYRGALDRALADPDGFAPTQAEWSLLEEAFSRGFTDAYLTGERGSALMGYTRPNNRGVLVGRVARVDADHVWVELERPLDARDTIEVWTGSGRFAQAAGEMVVDGRPRSGAPAGASARLALERRARVGDRVFRVADATLAEAARRTFSGTAAADTRATPVRFGVRLAAGEPLALSAEADGTRVDVTGPVVAPARTKEITVTEVMDHVGRLGGSGHRACGWDIDVESGVGIGYSALHAARREALERLEDARLEAWARRERRYPRIEAPARTGGSRTRTPAVVAVAWEEAVARAAVEAGAEEVYLRVFGAPRVLPDGVRPFLPRVVWPDEVEALEQWLGSESGTAIVGNLGLMGRGRRISADWSLNVTNGSTAEALADLGASSVWASPELSGRQLATLVEQAPVPTGALVWGRTELMVAEQCVLEAAGACGHRCASCPRRSGWWRLRDRKGYEMPVTTDEHGRSHIMNAVTLDLVRALDEVVGAGVAALRIDFSDEDATRAAEVVRALRSARDVVVAGGPPPSNPLVTPSTSGHLYRGVL
ncbi:MAG: U32 family peptidase [Aeromicrobium sp.]|nr:U32 family peptidase [Aeromicrobium sp.]